MVSWRKDAAILEAVLLSMQTAQVMSSSRRAAMGPAWLVWVQGQLSVSAEDESLHTFAFVAQNGQKNVP